MAPSPPAPGLERIGVVLVHGIGEQPRFEHLSEQARELISALQDLRNRGEIGEVSVDVAGTGAAAFHAEQDTWNAGPNASVTIVIRGNEHTPERRLLLHEVWWADVNEPYSLAKQFRFWLWGLAVWAHPGKWASTLGTADHVAPPVVPDSSLWDRARLFLVGWFFVLLGCSVGAISFLATRLFNWRAPRVLRVIANYMSSVKLYTQQERFGPGLFWSRLDFLDTVGEPPRVSIRRRMIRTIADVSCNHYGRWYVLAHSQGAVVAFNGLMETAYAWPGYLNEERWKRLRKEGMAGPGRDGMDIPQGRTMPRRPGWAAPADIAYRRKIFARFRGLLTYGSPLEKFAGLWPALVPVSREPAFDPHIPWLNVLDPTDPVSGLPLAFEGYPEECCPRPTSLGYGASWWLLLSHLKYLTRRPKRQDLATTVCQWLLDDDAKHVLDGARGWQCGTFFEMGPSSSPPALMRRVIAWLSWLGSAAILAGLGAIMLPIFYGAAARVFGAAWGKLAQLGPWLGSSPPQGAGTLTAAATARVGPFQLVGNVGYGPRVLAIVAGAGLLTLIAGAIARLPIFFAEDPDDVRRHRGHAKASRTLKLNDPAFVLPTDEPV